MGRGHLVTTDLVAYGTFQSPVTHDLTDASVTIEVLDAGTQAASSEAALYASIDPTNQYTMTINDSMLTFRYFDNDPNPDGTHVADLPYDPVTHRYLRLSHDSAANTITFAAGPDGIQWPVQRTTPAVVAVTAISYGFDAGTYLSVPAPGTPTFDNFSVVGPHCQ